MTGISRRFLSLVPLLLFAASVSAAQDLSKGALGKAPLEDKRAHRKLLLEPHGAPPVLELQDGAFDWTKRVTVPPHSRFLSFLRPVHVGEVTLHLLRIQIEVVHVSRGKGLDEKARMHLHQGLHLVHPQILGQELALVAKTARSTTVLHCHPPNSPAGETAGASKGVLLPDPFVLQKRDLD